VTPGDPLSARPQGADDWTQGVFGAATPNGSTGRPDCGPDPETQEEAAAREGCAARLFTDESRTPLS